MKTKARIPDGPVVYTLPADAGDLGLIPAWEEFISCEATASMLHNYWACTLEPVWSSKRSHRNERPLHYSEREAPTACN